MDIRKSYYDPEMVKNLSVMLRLSPEEVINKLWNNRVPTTMTKAQTTEEMLAKNPNSVLSELHDADDRDHAALERRAARIDPRTDEPTRQDDDDMYRIMQERGPNYDGITAYDSEGNEHRTPASEIRAQEAESQEARALRQEAQRDATGDDGETGEERGPVRPRRPQEPARPRRPQEPIKRSFSSENVARAFAGNPYVGQEFDPATLAGLSRLTGMPVEEVAFKISQSNDNMEKGIGDLVSRAANYVKEKVTGAKPAKPETQDQGYSAYQAEAEEENRNGLIRQNPYRETHRFGNAGRGAAEWRVPNKNPANPDGISTHYFGDKPQYEAFVAVPKPKGSYGRGESEIAVRKEMRVKPGAYQTNDQQVDYDANVRNTRIRNDQLRGQARGETGEIDRAVRIKPDIKDDQIVYPNTIYRNTDYPNSEQHKQRSGGYRKDVAAAGQSGRGARSGMAPALGPGEDIHDPKNMMLANSMNGKDKPEMNLEKARQISSMMGIPLDEVLRKLAKAEGIEWEVRKAVGETYGRDPDETTNPAENTNTNERPATNRFDPGTREGVLNDKTTEIDGKEYKMSDAAAAAMAAARAQGRTLDPSHIANIQHKPGELNRYVNSQGVRTDESTRNLNTEKPPNKLPNRPPERDNLNLSLVDVFYGRTMSKSKKKINRG